MNEKKNNILKKLILVLFVRLFALCLFKFVGFLFLLVSGKLRFVIVALPGLFSYLCLQIISEIIIKWAPCGKENCHLTIHMGYVSFVKNLFLSRVIKTLMLIHYSKNYFCINTVLPLP